MKSIADIIPTGGIIPVCTIDDPERAAPLARTLQDCGIGIMEITLRTEAAVSAVKNARQACPEMSVGIGTVTSVEQLRQAKQVGAHFCVSPGLTQHLTHAAQQLALPYLPGVCTVSEVMVARELGLRYLKFFPAEAAGGTKTLAMFRELFPDTCFCPTGGLNAGNYKDYLSLDNVFCIGGSWLAPREQVATGDWEGVKNAISELPVVNS